MIILCKSLVEDGLRKSSMESRSLPSGSVVQKPLILAAESACTTSSSEMGTAASQRQAFTSKALNTYRLAFYHIIDLLNLYFNILYIIFYISMIFCI